LSKFFKLVLPYIITIVFNLTYSFISFLMIVSFLFSVSDDLSLIPRDQLIAYRSIKAVVVALVFFIMIVINFLLAKWNRRFNYIPLLYWFLTLIISLNPYAFLIQQIL